MGTIMLMTFIILTAMSTDAQTQVDCKWLCRYMSPQSCYCKQLQGWKRSVKRRSVYSNVRKFTDGEETGVNTD